MLLDQITPACYAALVEQFPQLQTIYNAHTQQAVIWGSVPMELYKATQNFVAKWDLEN